MTPTDDGGLVRATLRRFAIAGVLSLAALVGAAAVPSSPARFDLIAWAFYFQFFAAVASGFLPQGRTLLRTPAEGESAATDHTTLSMIVGVIAVVALLIFINPVSMLVATLADLPPNQLDTDAPGNPPVNVAPLLAAMVLLNGLLVVLDRVRMTDGRGLVARVLAAPWLHESPIPGAWVRMVGVVEDPTPVEVDRSLAAFALVTDTEVVPGSDPNIEVKRFETVGTFVVRSGSTSVEVDPRGLYWSGPSTSRIEGVAPSGRTRVLAKDYLPVGARVIVCGRLRAQPSMVYRDVPFVLRATAEDPVMVLRDDDPEALLATWRLALRVHGVLTVAVIAMFVLLIGVVIGVLPNLPPLHLPPNSGSSDD